MHATSKAPHTYINHKYQEICDPVHGLIKEGARAPATVWTDDAEIYYRSSDPKVITELPVSALMYPAYKNERTLEFLNENLVDGFNNWDSKTTADLMGIGLDQKTIEIIKSKYATNYSLQEQLQMNSEKSLLETIEECAFKYNIY